MQNRCLSGESHVFVMQNIADLFFSVEVKGPGSLQSIADSHMYVMYIYIYIYRERERDREREMYFIYIYIYA